MNRSTQAARRLYSADTGPGQLINFAVWHLVGPQACGKTQFARVAIETIMATGVSAVLLDAFELQTFFAGNPAKVAADAGTHVVILLETNQWDRGEHPRHWMRGDRLIDCTNYLAGRDRRPGLERMLVKAMLDQPTRSVGELLSQVKNQYSGLARSMLDLSAIASRRTGAAA